MKSFFNNIRQEILSGEVSHDTLQRFKQTFSDKSQEEEVKHLLNMHLEHLPSSGRTFNIDLNFRLFWEAIERKKRDKQRSFHISRFWRTAGIAASVMLIAALAITGYLLRESLFLEKYDVVVNGTKGTMTHTVLPDSSIVYLNSNSEIKYSSHKWDSQREVVIKGEAFFEVSHNQKKSFVVHTSQYDVEVLGTRFNIKDPANGQNVVTTLRDGSIRVSWQDSDCDEFKPVVLKPNEQLVFNKRDCNFRVNKVNDMKEIAWSENKIVLKNSNFGELLKNLELKYGVEISVRDSSLLSYHYDGTITNETIEEVMTIIKMTMPISYHFEGSRIVIETNTVDASNQ